MIEQQAVPVAQEAMTQPGFVVWHSSEEDGGPDVGITVGLGDGKMLWIGERSGREGDGMGLLVYGDQAIDANASLGEYDEIRDLIEQHVAPVLSRLASLPCKSGEGAGDREAIARIIDPHSFCDVPFTDEPVLLDMVEQSKGDALRKADRILALTPDATQTREAELAEILQAIMDGEETGEGWANAAKRARAALNARGGA